MHPGSKLAASLLSPQICSLTFACGCCLAVATAGVGWVLEACNPTPLLFPHEIGASMPWREGRAVGGLGPSRTIGIFLLGLGPCGMEVAVGGVDPGCPGKVCLQVSSLVRDT